MDERCETCRWRSHTPRMNPDRGTAEFQAIMYACQRRAPVVSGGLHGPSMTLWPLVHNGNFCGEHSPRTPTGADHDL